MTVNATLRLNLTGAESDPKARSDRYMTAIEIAAYCDQAGFSSVNVEEHHVAENGWLPSPLTMAAAIAARTENCSIGVMALLVALYDPVRLAEDIAVIDLISQGRLNFVAGMGYRAKEFHALDKPYKERGVWMDHVLETLIKAWADEPFEYRGEMINVTPKPFSRPHPMFLVGGMSKPAARRAARFGLSFCPPGKMPELENIYYEELEKNGFSRDQGFVYNPPEDFSMLFIDQDPESAWEELGGYFLNEAVEYRSWKQEGLFRPLELSSDSVEALRAENFYEIITPDECIRRHKNNPEFGAGLHPLCGGIPLDRAWDCVNLYVDKVIPAIS